MTAFWETVMGRRLIEGTVPKLAKELERLNKNLERLIELEEKRQEAQKEDSDG